MAKGYWIVNLDVEDATGYAEYVAVVRPLLELWNGTFLVRGGTYEVTEGNVRSRSVVIEFASYKQAYDCYHSEEYYAAMQFRLTSSVANFVVVEGL